MSDLDYFAVGLGIGLLIVVPVFVAYRHEMTLNFRKLFGMSAEVEDDEGGPENAAGLSPSIVIFSFGVAALTTVYGVVSGAVIFVGSGIFIMLCLLLAVLAGRATHD
jgi:hypothetical protein